MKSKTIVISTFCTILLAGLLGGPSAAGAEDKVIASFERSGDEARAVGWFYTSEEPLKRRDIGQTFKSNADGALRKIVFPLTGGGNQAAFHETKDFAVTIYDHGQSAPADRPTQGSKSGEQAGTGKLDEGGNSFIITLDESYPVMAGNYYTFVLEWKSPDSANKISIQQGTGTPESHRWHRVNRGSWTRSPDSLVFRAVAE